MDPGPLVLQPSPQTCFFFCRGHHQWMAMGLWVKDLVPKWTSPDQSSPTVGLFTAPDFGIVNIDPQPAQITTQQSQPGCQFIQKPPICGEPVQPQPSAGEITGRWGEPTALSAPFLWAQHSLKLSTQWLWAGLWAGRRQQGRWDENIVAAGSSDHSRTNSDGQWFPETIGKSTWETLLSLVVETELPFRLSHQPSEGCEIMYCYWLQCSNSGTRYCESTRNTTEWSAKAICLAGLTLKRNREGQINLSRHTYRLSRLKRMLINKLNNL